MKSLKAKGQDVGKRKKTSETLMAVITWGAAAVTMGVLLFLILFILIRGVPHITPDLFSLNYTSDNVSLTPAMVSTVMITLMSLVVAVPLGVFSAIYLVEYAGRGNKAVTLVRTTTETLSGIPSIVYGLFGMLFFVNFLHLGYSLLAGALTLAVMILPLIMRSSEEALKAVPDTYREGAFGLGSGRLRTVFRIVLPSAMPGILAGVILAVGRIVGETAALIYTSGTATEMPSGPLSSARTLSVHMYSISSEGLHTDQGYATAVVLMAVVIGINTLSAFIAKRVGGKAR
ncbi:phosphate transport system permease protein PstA [Clostridia bacterium]|nr:phosphate transport system permease protein PstA [Clostridia bacterium]